MNLTFVARVPYETTEVKLRLSQVSLGSNKGSCLFKVSTIRDSGIFTDDWKIVGVQSVPVVMLTGN